MTDAELRQLAEDWVKPEYQIWGYDRDAKALAARFLALLADQEGRGEVVDACPRCSDFDIRKSQTQPGVLICRDCHAMFTEPAYFQRITKPQEPKPDIKTAPKVAEAR